jgi:hypothetical protein
MESIRANWERGVKTPPANRPAFMPAPQLSEVQQCILSLDERLAALESALDEMRNRLDKLETRVGK